MALRVLVACEYSGTVSQAFRAEGHNVISCDLEPSPVSAHHYKGDVLRLIKCQKFDLMIAHPPCTWLAKAQLHRQDSFSITNRLAAFNFVHTLWNAPIPHIAIGNPIGWLNTAWMPPQQIVYANEFGSPYGKDICLWLKDLPPLITGYLSPGKKKVANHVNSRMSQAVKSKIKSKFFPEVATAMAAQWTEKYLSTGKTAFPSPPVEIIPKLGRLASS